MHATPDLYALVIRLRPERSGPPIDARGHGAQALFLDLLRQVAPVLAEQLHDDAPSKPYSVAVLPARSDAMVELRVAFTRADLFPLVTRALLAQAGAPTLRLGRAALALDTVFGTPGSHAWAGFGAFAALAGAARPGPGITLEFATPTAFGQGSRADGRARLGLLPTPEIVFPSIARRWNELAPPDLQLDLDHVRAACDETLVSRYELATAQISLGKGPQKGFRGLCSYELPADPAQSRLLNLLADAVFFLGLGVKTARGMGLCRRVEL